jgi:peptide/nickel transport system ATP-binding protein
MNDPILELRDVTKTYRKGKGRSKELVCAAYRVSLRLAERQILALVGESGSGKTTLARLVTAIERPDAGAILFRGQTLGRPRGRALFEYRRRVQMIFQDPFASLNPLNTIAYTLERPLANYLRLPRQEMQSRVRELLRTVRLVPPEDYLYKLPYELSGGQLQRVGIARALASQPELIVADEPVSMLDVSIRAEVLQLLDELRSRQGLSLVYITHDLVSARALADEILVLYRGRVVEYGAALQVARQPSHPYTQLLLRSIPDPWHPELNEVTVDTTVQVETPTRGCVFAPRCPFAMAQCREVEPKLVTVASGQQAACFLYSDEVEPAAKGGMDNGSARH